MIKQKLKQCDGPCGEMKYIWKNQDGKKYCRDCANSSTGVAKPGKSKPKSKQKFIPLRSSKRAKEEVLYSTMRLVFLKQHPNCAGKFLILGCTNRSTECHHKKGRVGKLFLDTTEWIALCHTCHVWVENNPIFARDLDLSGSRLETRICSNCNEEEVSKDNKWCMSCRMEG